MPAAILQQISLSENLEDSRKQLELEIEKCTHVQQCVRRKVREFMEVNQIWHISNLTYYWRTAFQEYLDGSYVQSVSAKYMKGFDRIKQYSLQNQLRLVSGNNTALTQYENQLLFLPYYPNQEIAAQFERAHKKELLWDFQCQAPELMKKQIFITLHEILESDENIKLRRERLAALKKFYGFCIEQSINDIEALETEHIDLFKKALRSEKRMASIMSIVDYCRKAVFMRTEKIHWNANVWYMQRFQLAPERIDPARPVAKLSFLEVTHKKNREILQKYLKYGLGLTDLSIQSLLWELTVIKKFVVSIQQIDTETVCSLTGQDMHGYFSELQKERLADTTYNRIVMSIVHFYNFLRVRGYIEKVPFYADYYLRKTVIRHNDRCVELNTIMEILGSLNGFQDDIRFMFLHLWGVGLRISEVCTLKGDAYVLQNQDTWIQVYQTKMRSYKKVPIPNALYRLMKVYIKKYHIKADDYVFQNSHGGPFCSETFRSKMKALCKNYRIQGGEYNFQPHSYRHNLATFFYKNEVSIQCIRDYLGHENEEMTRQYIDFMPQKIDQANEDFFNHKENSLTVCL